MRNVIQASSFSVIQTGRVVIVAFNSPEDLKEMARTLVKLANLNDGKEESERYTRIIRGLKDSEPPYSGEEIQDALAVSDEYVGGRSMTIPVIDTDTHRPSVR